MGKKERVIKQLFKTDVSQKYISDKKKEQAVNRLLCEAKATAKECANAEKKYKIYNANRNDTTKDLAFCNQNITVMSCFSQIAMNLKYMSKKLYLLQIIIVLAGVFINITIPKETPFGTTFFEEGIYANAIISSAIFSTIAIIACNIGDRYGMAELAGSCFFNQRQVCVLRMVLSGAVSLMALGALLCAVYKYADRPLWIIGVYILVPYFVTGCVQFLLLQIELLGRSQYVLWGGGLVMAVLFGIIAFERKIYDESAIGMWILVMVLSGAAMAYELCSLLSKIEKGDLLCMS